MLQRETSNVVTDAVLRTHIFLHMHSCLICISTQRAAFRRPGSPRLQLRTNFSCISASLRCALERCAAPHGGCAVLQAARDVAAAGATQLEANWSPGRCTWRPRQAVEADQHVAPFERSRVSTAEWAHLGQSEPRAWLLCHGKGPTSAEEASAGHRDGPDATAHWTVLW